MPKNKKKDPDKPVQITFKQWIGPPVKAAEAHPCLSHMEQLAEQAWDYQQAVIDQLHKDMEELEAKLRESNQT